MAPKKKTPKNPFYFFVMEFKERMERRGITYPGGLKEAFTAAGPDWQRLSKEEKSRYEAMARDHKLGPIQKYTTTGKSFDQVDQELQEKKAEEARMQSEIKTTVAILDKKALQRKVFYFMHVNYYCRVDEKQYIPCELAICQFNFACGAFDLYHTLINPGKIPIGYAFEAKKKSEETHQIPDPPPSSAETNFSKILFNIVNFMKGDIDGGKFPPVYTHGNDGTPEAVQDVLDTLCELEGAQEHSRIHPLPESFRVYPLPKLFFELRNKAGDLAGKTSKAFPVESLAARELEKNLYSFTPGICCEMHEGTDASQYCSLSIIRRWSFIIADHCCKDLGVEITPGQHIPPPVKPMPNITHAHVMPEKEERKSIPAVPSIIDHSRRPTPRKTAPFEVTAEDKLVKDPPVPTLIDYSKTDVPPIKVIDNDKLVKEPPVPTLIDYSKTDVPSIQKPEPVISVGRGRSMVTNFSGVVRKPKSIGMALQGIQNSNLSEEDFPAIQDLSLRNCMKHNLSKVPSRSAEPNSTSPLILLEEDFPAIGGSSRENSNSSSTIGQFPAKFAGRGASFIRESVTPSKGRGIFGLLDK